jgi:4-amino-4-deoxy-L-arabinose transferase-like glycosyltransferase
MVPLVCSWSYAEAPFLLLTTSCAGCLLLRGQNNALSVTIVAALLALAAAHTKNEGVMFALLAAMWLLVLPGQQKKLHFIIFLVVFAVGYIPWYLWISYGLDLSSHATAGLQFNLDNIERAFGRTGPAFKVILNMWGDIKQLNIVLGGSLVLFFLTLFRKKSLVLFLLPIAMLFGYFIIVVFHQAEIYWQVGTSWNRLTLHVLPMLVVASVCLLAEGDPATK